MTLKIDLTDIRTRIAERKRQKAARAAALRDRGVVVLPTRTKIVHVRTALARVLPWRQRED